MRVTETGASALDGKPFVIDGAKPTGLANGAIIGIVGQPDIAGRQPVEVIVDGWRFEFIVEDAGPADLRERASRDRAGQTGAGEALEIRAIIPGRIASVAVTPGDVVEMGQTLLAVEAMKMQNELRAPRPGSVARVVTTAGSTVEVGDLLVVLE
jgi:biotin carboxyl carrier protein